MIHAHIPGLPPFDAPDDVWCMADVYRKPYVKVKYEIAAELRPQHICEIGVYSGIAALCFLAASPTASYLGVDDLSAERCRGLNIVAATERLLDSFGYNATVLTADSQALSALPGDPFDFIHVDGNHSLDGARHDVLLAWQALVPGGHILIDNAHDSAVCAGTFSALNRCASLLDWRYINEGVGSILVRRPE